MYCVLCRNMHWMSQLHCVYCSAFCLFEFETALHHWITKKRTRRLIVLMALDSPTELYANDASDTVVLRQYLCHYTYIDYMADDWVEKLLYALPLHGMNRQHAENNDDDVVHGDQ